MRKHFKLLFLLIFVLFLGLISCNDANSKTDNSDNGKINNPTETNNGDKTGTLTNEPTKTEPVDTEPVIIHEHTFSSTYSYNEDSHWYQSTCEHDLKKDEEAHNFVKDEVSDDADAIAIRYTCIACGYSYEEQVHVHTFSDVYSYNSEYHWFDCTCEHHDDIPISFSPHTFYEDHHIEATEDNQGEILYICSECNYEYFEIIPKIDHVHDYHLAYNEEGHYMICDKDQYIDPDYDMQAHTFSEWINDNEIDCDNPTTTSRSICSVCGYECVKTVTHETVPTGWNYMDIIIMGDEDGTFDVGRSTTCASCGKLFGEYLTLSLEENGRSMTREQFLSGINNENNYHAFYGTMYNYSQAYYSYTTGKEYYGSYLICDTVRNDKFTFDYYLNSCKFDLNEFDEKINSGYQAAYTGLYVDDELVYTIVGETMGTNNYIYYVNLKGFVTFASRNPQMTTLPPTGAVEFYYFFDNVDDLELLLQSLSSSSQTYSHTKNIEFEEEWRYDENNHAHQSKNSYNGEYLYIDYSEHTFVYKETVAPTYSEEGYDIYYCSVCEYETHSNIEAKLEHIYSDIYTYTESEHWKDCLDEGYSDLYFDKGSHDFDVTITIATYDGDGLEVHTCKVCNYSYDVVLPQLIHVYDENYTYDEVKHWRSCLDEGYSELFVDGGDHEYITTVIPRTINKDGYTHHECICGKYYDDEFIDSYEKESLKYLRFTLESSGTYSVTIYNKATYVYIPSTYEGVSVTKVGANAASNNRNLKYVYIPEGVTEIGSYAFYNCYNLYQVDIPSTMITINNSAFNNCYNLASVINHSSLSITKNSNQYGYVGYYAKEIITDASESQLKVEDGFVIYDETTLINYIGDNRSIRIPEGITIIETYAFYNNSRMYQLILSSTLVSNKSNYTGINNLLEVVNLSNTVLPYNLRNIASVVTNLEDSKIFKTDDGFILCNLGDVCYLLEYIGDSKILSIPSGITYIYSYAFYDMGIEEITVPESVTFLGENALGGSDLKKIYWNAINATSYAYNAGVAIYNKPIGVSPNLEEVIFGENVSTIPHHMFAQFNHIVNITIPKSVISIGDNAFFDCESLTTVTFEEGSLLESIGKSSFSMCSNLNNIVLPSHVTSIGDGAFGYCYALTNITLNDGLLSLGASVFNSCSGMQTIALPNTLESLGNNAFYGCSALTTISLPNSLKTIGNSIFTNCYKINYVTLDGLKYIGNEENPYLYLYGVNDKSLTTYTINSNTKFIGNGVFNNLSNLSSITLGDGIIGIGSNAFKGTILTEITIGENIKYIGSQAFGSITTLEVVYYNAIDANLEEIFKGSNNISRVVIGENVEVIPNTFMKSTSSSYPLFTEIENDSTKLTKVGSYAFYYCINLESFDLTGVTEIGSSAFFGCSNFTLDLSSSVKAIGDLAFSEIKDVDKVVISNDVEFGRNVFKNTHIDDFTIDIEVDQYQMFYQQDIRKLTFGDHVTMIAESAFSNSTIEVLDLNKVETIDRYAFYNCGSLVELTIPENVQSIQYYAFANCGNLTTVHWNAINATVNSIFYNDSVSTLTIGENVKSIPGGVFSQFKITEVALPEGLETINSNAFYNTLLTEVTIPSTVTNFTSGFENCSLLKNVYFKAINSTHFNQQSPFNGSPIETVVFGDDVENIQSYLFANISTIKEVVIPENVVTIGYHIFETLDKLTINAKELTSANDAFFGATEIVFGDSCEKVLDGMIYSTKASTVKKVVLGKNVQTIIKGSFAKFTNLEEVVYNCIDAINHPTNLLDTIFASNNKVAKITIGKDVEKIYIYAFYNLTGVSEVVYEGTMSEWSSIELEKGWNYLGGYGSYITTVKCSDGNVTIE